MTYRASADWDLHFNGNDALAAAADTLTRAHPEFAIEPDAGPQTRVRAAFADIAAIQDFGFDDGPGLHLTGWTGGALNVAHCETVMAALVGRATGTIDWSDEEGTHWRDRLSRDGRWEQYPGIVVYPDGEASDAFVVLEHGRITNDPTLPVLDLDPLTRYTPDFPVARELVVTLRTAAESCDATEVALRCDEWLPATGSTQGLATTPFAVVAHPAPSAVPRGRGASLT